MKKMKIGAAALSLALCLGSTPVFADEAFEEGGSGEIQNEVAQYYTRKEGTPLFYNRDMDPTITTSDVNTMFRLYNPNSGEHFYTHNQVEKNTLADKGWKLEGVGWFAPKTSDAPVYRLYNANAGDHHYTTSKDERDALIKAGWKDEGIGWYSETNNGLPLYRSYNPNAKAGSHNYTLSTTEYNTLTLAGWKPEGQCWNGTRISVPAEDLVKDLSDQITDYQARMEKAVQDQNPGDLYDRGLRISNTLKSLDSQLPNRRFAFQNGKLVGVSLINSEEVNAPTLDAKAPVVVISPGRRQIMLAEGVENMTLSGKATFLSTSTTPSLYTSASGILEGGLFNGRAARFERYYTGYLWQNELAIGNAKNNVMDGRIDMHTRNIRSVEGSPDQFRWFMTVENGTAKAEKKDGYYYVYKTPDQSVYYDFLPQNLKFWYE